MINSFNTSLFILIVCVLAIVGPQPIMNSYFDITTATPTTDSYSQTLTATSITFSQTSTPTVTPSITPTTTLMPLPAITLVFPAPTKTPRVTGTPESVLRTQIPNPNEESVQKSNSPRMKALSIAVVLLWLFLAVFVVIYIRQLK